jgi:hypothetical protein
MHQAEDDRITQYIAIAEQLIQGDFTIQISVTPTDAIGRLGQLLNTLAQSLEARYQEIQRLNAITARINVGLLLDEVLDGVFQDFKEFIPFDRIGFSGIEKEGTIVRSYWAKSDLPVIKLVKNYAAHLEGSSLADIVSTGQPRIINDLEEYLNNKPDSASTRLMVAEGIRSSLTCPLLANGTPIGFIFFSSAQTGTYAHAHVDIFQNIANQLSVIIEKGRLVSELAAQKVAIEHQNELLARLNEQKNTFLGVAAHDLRNPLGIILTATDLMLSEDYTTTPESHHYFLTSIQRQTEYMLSLLNDLLDVSHIESGKLSVNIEQVNVAEFLQQIIEMNTRQAESKKMKLVLEATDDGTAWFDPMRIQQVIDNLLSNAIKFSSPGSVIRFRARHTAPVWRIEVQDEGPGVTIEDRQHIFQDFAKLSAKPTGGEKSTGLGLAITRRVIEAHGGKIGVDSVPGQGANFWFTLSGT